MIVVEGGLIVVEREDRNWDREERPDGKRVERDIRKGIEREIKRG